MKSDSEMVESILKKAHEKEKSMKKTKKITAIGLAVVLAVCAAAGVSFLTHRTPSATVPETPETSETSGIVPAEPTDLSAAHGFTLLVASAAQAEAEETVTPVEHTSGVKLPVCGKLVIEDAAGWSEEKKNLRKLQLNDILSSEWMTSKSSYHVSNAESENYIGSLAVQGKFILFVEDADALEKIEIGCGAYGKLMIMPATQNGKTPIMSAQWLAAVKQEQSLTVSAQEYKDVYLNSDVDEATGAETPIGMYVNYDLSDALLAEKELHPDMGYEQFADEITFRAVYQDGSENTYTLQLTFDETGALSVSMK